MNRRAFLIKTNSLVIVSLALPTALLPLNSNTNHLGVVLRARPEKLRQRMLQVFSSNDNSLTSMLISTSKTKETNDFRYEWELKHFNYEQKILS